MKKFCYLSVLYCTGILFFGEFILNCQSTNLSNSKSSPKIIACYYESWAVYRPGKGLFDLHNIDTSLCTHGMYTFAGLDAATNKIVSLDPYNDLFVGYGLGGYRRFTDLAKDNPNFIPMLSVGGWNEGSIKYSRMASSPESRKSFIDSALEFMKDYKFQGLDLDWEYPTQRGGKPEDKANFIQLLKELREAFQPYGYLLSAAVSAGKTNIDAAYDIPSVSNYLDFINLMTYDYHGDWEPYTGLNAPLYARPDEVGDNRFLNVNFSINYWIDNGALASKINLGLGTYGRTFSLADPNKHGFYDPVYGPGEAGPYTEEPGDLGYNEAQLNHPERPVVLDEYYQAPYTYYGNQWIGYDDMESIRKKSEMVNNYKLGGAMVWAIDTDDFLGVCGNGVYPLLHVIREVLHGN